MKRDLAGSSRGWVVKGDHKESIGRFLEYWCPGAKGRSVRVALAVSSIKVVRVDED